MLNDLERISDHTENFYEITEEMRTKGISFSEVARNEMIKVCLRIRRMLEISKDAFENLNRGNLPELALLENEVDGLKKELIASHFIRLAEGETRINVKIKGQEEWDINAPGPRVDEKAIEDLMARMDGLQKGDFLILSGSVAPGMPADSYEKMLERIRGKGAEALIDAEGALLRKTLDFKPFLVKPNHLELGDLYGVKLHYLEETEEYARKLQEEGARNVLVSCGAEGALLLDEHGKVYRRKNAKGAVKNTVGCGDSTVAGFLAGWLKTGDYAEALRWAVACGNATAFSDTLAKKEEILSLL